VSDQSSDASNEPKAGSDEEQSADLSAKADESAEAENSTSEAGDGEVASPPTEAGGTSEAVAAAAATLGQESPAGWFQDPNVPNQQRYWDGSAWTDQRKEAAGGVSTTKRSADERKALLAQQLQSGVARGLRIESQSDYQAVLVEGKPINHVLHAIITIFSCGLWGIVWIILAITGGEKREMVVVDEFGNVQLQKLGKA
jgi:hypothetical protein